MFSADTLAWLGRVKAARLVGEEGLDDGKGGYLVGDVGRELGSGGWNPALVIGRLRDKAEGGLIAGLSEGKKPDCLLLGDGDGGILESDCEARSDKDGPRLFEADSVAVTGSVAVGCPCPPFCGVESGILSSLPLTAVLVDASSLSSCPRAQFDGTGLMRDLGTDIG